MEREGTGGLVVVALWVTMLVTMLATGCGRVGFVSLGVESDADLADRPDAEDRDTSGVDVGGLDTGGLDVVASDAGNDSDTNPPDGGSLVDPVPDPDLQRVWVERSPATVPGRINCMGTAYHRTLQKTFFYGGRDGFGDLLNEMWEYDGTDWRRVCDVCPPGKRAWTSLVYDEARDVLVLFGGKSATDTFNVVWEWSEADGWQLRDDIVGPPPAPRYSAFVAYDSSRRTMVVFAGAGAPGGDFEDLFEYDGVAWTAPETPAIRPAARSRSCGPSATYVGPFALEPRARERMVIFGGEIPGAIADDAWAWGGVTWERICDDCTGTRRTSVNLAYDPATGRIVLGGGYTGSTEIAGTWELDETGFRQVSPLLQERDSSAFVYDWARDRLVLFGGNGDSCTGRGNCDETYEYIRPPP